MGYPNPICYPASEARASRARVTISVQLPWSMEVVHMQSVSRRAEIELNAAVGGTLFGSVFWYDARKVTEFVYGRAVP